LALQGCAQLMKLSCRPQQQGLQTPPLSGLYSGSQKVPSPARRSPACQHCLGLCFATTSQTSVSLRLRYVHTAYALQLSTVQACLLHVQLSMACAAVMNLLANDAHAVSNGTVNRAPHFSWLQQQLFANPCLPMRRCPVCPAVSWQEPFTSCAMANHCQMTMATTLRATHSSWC
jgi:hypothetical protein